jgi:hypothetical protein
MQAFFIWHPIPPLFTFYSPFIRPLVTYHSPTISLLSTFYQPSTIPAMTATSSTVELTMATLLNAIPRAAHTPY